MAQAFRQPHNVLPIAFDEHYFDGARHMHELGFTSDDTEAGTVCQVPEGWQLSDNGEIWDDQGRLRANLDVVDYPGQGQATKSIEFLSRIRLIESVAYDPEQKKTYASFQAQVDGRAQRVDLKTEAICGGNCEDITDSEMMRRVARRQELLRYQVQAELVATFPEANDPAAYWDLEQAEIARQLHKVREELETLTMPWNKPQKDRVPAWRRAQGMRAQL